MQIICKSMYSLSIEYLHFYASKWKISKIICYKLKHHLAVFRIAQLLVACWSRYQLFSALLYFHPCQITHTFTLTFPISLLSTLCMIPFTVWQSKRRHSESAALILSSEAPLTCFVIMSKSLNSFKFQFL